MIYTRRNPDVAAIRWTGDNLPEVTAFLEEHTGLTAEELGVRNEQASYLLFGEPRSYNMLLFYAWNDDQEVDLDRWIVIELGEDEGGLIYEHPDFVAKFIKKEQ